MDIAVGIDVGTTGVRAVAMDRAGAVVAKAEAAMPAPALIEGHLRQDAQIWWAAVSEALDRLGIAVERSRIAAIGVDGTSGTILPIDAGGSPLGLASMYNDTAHASDAARVAALAPRDTAARGAKMEDRRPDLIILDDLDRETDSHPVTDRKIATLTRAVLPAGSADV